MKSITINSKLENKGHYVPGVVSNGMLYISGQLPVHHETGAPLADNITQQTLDALHNVELVLNAAGLKKENVIMCHVYIP
ncbi:MAG: RidA family protein, partial [Anaerovibrio sp.]|uniref:RidA family protein n=1 Tax=Anaerovibrio sp. TaxID=1872532 RepID=UPI001B02C95C